MMNMYYKMKNKKNFFHEVIKKKIEVSCNF